MITFSKELSLFHETTYKVLVHGELFGYVHFDRWNSFVVRTLEGATIYQEGAGFAGVMNKKSVNDCLLSAANAVTEYRSGGKRSQRKRES